MEIEAHALINVIVEFLIMKIIVSSAKYCSKILTFSFKVPEANIKYSVVTS